MNPHLIWLACVAIALMLTACRSYDVSTDGGAGRPVVIHPIPPTHYPSAGLASPLVKPDDTSWRDTAPPTWTGQGNGVAARLWLARTRDALLVRVAVEDPQQVNTYRERNLWRGDCIYLALDGRGDTTAEQIEANTPGPDDAMFIFALAADGPEARVSQHPNPNRVGAQANELIRAIVRDEARKTTTYDLAIPYSEINTAYGQSPSIGVAACIAHKDADGKDLNWGRINSSKEAKRQYNTVWTPAEGEFATIAPKVQRLWKPGQRASAGVAVSTSHSSRIRATLGASSVEVDVPKTFFGEVARYEVSVGFESVNPAADTLQIEVIGPNAASAQYTLHTPHVVGDRLDRHIARLLDPAVSPIARKHLESTRTIVREGLARLAFQPEEIDVRAQEFMNTVGMIDGKLPADRFDLDDHISRGLPLVFGFVSEVDQTLQYFTLQLPFAFDPAKTYPLVVYLHGAGSDNPIGYLATAFDNTGQDTLFRTEKIDPANVPPTHQAFVVAPWARGNSMYRHTGESDVWQSIEIARKHGKIDPERMYLTGFSMGCNGTYGIAARTPDMWAGINLAAGFGPWSDTALEFLDENLRNVPICGWIGELDSMADAGKKFQERLKGKGIDMPLTVVPKVPHTYPYAEYQKCVGYLMQFKRPARPNPFSFVADKGRHGGRNGVRVLVPRLPDVKNLPQFTCRIDGQTVTIDSKNTTGVEVNLGEEGLGMSGDVKLIWNGKPAYDGPVKTVELGEKIGWFGRLD